MDKIAKLANILSQRLRAVGVRAPIRTVLAAVLRTVQTASLITEEGRFVRGSVTYASRDWFADNRPSRLRADYPHFTRLESPIVFAPAAFAKLSRAVDQWSGSVAIHGNSPRSLQMWGLVDQFVGANTHLNRESPGGFAHPGDFTVIIERPGDFSVYSAGILLAALRSQVIVLKELDVLHSPYLVRKIRPSFIRTATAIRAALPHKTQLNNLHEGLLRGFCSTIARICIGLRRTGAGGSLLITPKPLGRILSITREMHYERLKSAMCLFVLDQAYERQLDRKASESRSVGQRDFRELSYATTDREDRVDELDGAVKFVTSLAALDGATLLSRNLDVIGFGVKIKGQLGAINVYDGASMSHANNPRPLDLSEFGMRRLSVLNYCRKDQRAIGVIVSQDGQVQVAMTVNSRLWMWRDIQLLDHLNYNALVAKEERRFKEGARKLLKMRATLGYSEMPKTLADLHNQAARLARGVAKS